MNKATATTRLFQRALANPKLVLSTLRERGLWQSWLKFAKSDADALRAIADELEGVEQVEPFDSSHFVFKLKTGERFLLRRKSLLSDMSAVKETFLRQVYGDHPNVQGQVVLDVGANIGDTAVYFAKKGASVVAYEPSKELFDLARRNAQLNGVEVEYWNVGVGGKRERALLTTSETGADMGSTTLFSGERTKRRIDPRHLRVDEVDIVPLSEVVKRFETIQLLKMDCEGCEFPALLSLGEDELRRIQHIIMEHHHNPDELIRKLKDNRFNIRRTGTESQAEGYIFADRTD